MARGPILATPELSPALKEIAKTLFLDSTRREINGCLSWRGQTMKVNGSPQPMWLYNGRNTTAARWAFELFVRPLKPGEMVWRTCGSHMCVNYDHIAAGRKTKLKAAPAPVEQPCEKVWRGGPRKAMVKPLRKIKASPEMKTGLTVDLTNEVLTWTLTSHAEDRMVEHKAERVDVLLAACYPEVSYVPDPRGRPDVHCRHRAHITVVVNVVERNIITVMPRLMEQWEHAVV